MMALLPGHSPGLEFFPLFRHLYLCFGEQSHVDYKVLACLSLCGRGLLDSANTADGLHNHRIGRRARCDDNHLSQRLEGTDGLQHSRTRGYTGLADLQPLRSGNGHQLSPGIRTTAPSRAALAPSPATGAIPSRALRSCKAISRRATSSRQAARPSMELRRKCTPAPHRARM